MSLIGAAVIGAALKVGAGLVKSVVEGQLGPGAGAVAGDLAGTVIDTIARKAGVEPHQLPDLAKSEPAKLEDAVLATEADMPELIALWSKGLDGQFALLQAETREGFWQSFWRWGWMYLLALFWIWRIIILPIVNSRPSMSIEAVDFGILMTLTSWFMALYMGGHTLKELGKNAMDAVRGRKGA